MIVSLKPPMLFVQLLGIANDYLGASPEMVLGKGKKKDLALIRACLMVLYRRSGATNQVVADKFNKDCHATVIHHTRNHEDRMAFEEDVAGNKRYVDKDYRDTYLFLEAKLNRLKE